MKVSVISLLLSTTAAITLEQLNQIQAQDCNTGFTATAGGTCVADGLAETGGCKCKKFTKAGKSKIKCKKAADAKWTRKTCGACVCKKVGAAKKCKGGKDLTWGRTSCAAAAQDCNTGFTATAGGTCVADGLAQDCNTGFTATAGGTCVADGLAQTGGCKCKKVTKAGKSKVVCKKAADAKWIRKTCGKCVCKKVGAAKKCKGGKDLSWGRTSCAAAAQDCNTGFTATAGGTCVADGLAQACDTGFTATAGGTCVADGLAQACNTGFHATTGGTCVADE